MIGLNDIHAAKLRIAGDVRTTPLIESSQLKEVICAGDLLLKLELLQVTGSFKARGAANKLRATPNAELEHGIVTASGGNHGLAVARAGALAGVAVTVFLPRNASASKISKLQTWGANTIVTGDNWSQADSAARAFADKNAACYFHPFADPLVVAGQGTLGLEILGQDPTIDTLLVAIGGGGLIAGVACVVKALAPAIRVVGVEAMGSPTLLRSLEAGRPVTIEKLTTSVATMACPRTTEGIVKTAASTVDEIVLVDDEEMLVAARWLWFEMGLAADLSGAAAIAAIQTGRVTLGPGSRACAIVCGAGPEALRAS